jgi:hypothetical protein
MQRIGRDVMGTWLVLLHQAEEVRSLLLDRLTFGLHHRRFQMVQVVIRAVDDLQRV